MPGKDIPHAEGCDLHPDTLKRRREEKQRNFLVEERWTPGTKIACEWTGHEWRMTIDVGGESVSRHYGGSAIHTLLKNAFRTWKAKRAAKGFLPSQGDL
jgi:hypothetical protein